jgi:hypothetical protein
MVDGTSPERRMSKPESRIVQVIYSAGPGTISAWEVVENEAGRLGADHSSGAVVGEQQKRQQLLNIGPFL